MFDKRVVRGNTYAAQILPATAQQEQMDLTRKSERKVKRTTPSAAKPRTPDAVEGRKHIDVQTEQYLEELTDRPVEVDIDTQTDAFMDQLPAPIFIPMKTGVDVETQVEDGELFDFDAEVEPILEVLVGKTLEQSMMEVMEEEELSNMRAHQEHFEQVRNAELAEVQRLEEAEKRRFEEKERRVAQELERKQRESQVTEKVAARTFTKGFLQELQSSVVANLQDAGFFYDPLEAEVRENFMPWLLDSMSTSMDQQRVAREIADDLIEAAGVRQALMQAEAAKLRAAVEEVKRIAAEKAAAEAAAAEAAAADAAAVAALFTLWDKDASGGLSVEELNRVFGWFDELSYEEKPPAAAQIFLMMNDRDASETLGPDEFVQYLTGAAAGSPLQPLVDSLSRKLTEERGGGEE